MLQFLIILLDDTATSFCHYNIPKDKNHRLIDLDDLKKGIRFAMMENLTIQFVYPDYDLPQKYTDIINSIDHVDIKPYTGKSKTNSEVVVFNDVPLNLLEDHYPTTIFRMTLQEFFDFPKYLAKQVCHTIEKINIVITSVDFFQTWDFDRYKLKLNELSEIVEQEYINGNTSQWNILTDRIFLTKMNNCNAGDTTITLAPNGKFYICPAFYYDNMDDSVGNINSGMKIPNQYLYKLQYAPICRHCDAYQCKRCVWLNRRKTLEVNTPSQEQCIISHLERNASRSLLYNIRKNGDYIQDIDIKEIDYLDPFNNREQWKRENL